MWLYYYHSTPILESYPQFCCRKKHVWWRFQFQNGVLAGTCWHTQPKKTFCNFSQTVQYHRHSTAASVMTCVYIANVQYHIANIANTTLHIGDISDMTTISLIWYCNIVLPWDRNINLSPSTLQALLVQLSQCPGRLPPLAATDDLRCVNKA